MARTNDKIGLNAGGNLLLNAGGALLANSVFGSGPMLIAHTTKTVASDLAATVTSDAIDTTGADLLVAFVTCAIAGALPTLTDSKGNAWVALTPKSASARCALYYAKNATVGTGHTFTASGGATLPAIYVQAFSSSDLSAPFDVENGSTGSAQPGSTGVPALDNSIIVTGCEGFTVTPNSINLSFTITDSNALIVNRSYAGGMAYLLQGAKAAVNPAWNTGDTCVIAVFKPTTVAAPSVAYSPTTVTVIKGSSVSIAAPTNTGGAIPGTGAYSETGTLPTGLTLNVDSGIILGTPTVVESQVGNTRVTNAGGTGDAPLTINVVLAGDAGSSIPGAAGSPRGVLDEIQHKPGIRQVTWNTPGRGVRI